LILPHARLALRRQNAGNGEGHMVQADGLAGRIDATCTTAFTVPVAATLAITVPMLIGCV